MLRKDVKCMLGKDWEPKIPKIDIIQKQSEQFKGKVSGSVRLGLGLVTINEQRTNEVLKKNAQN